METSRNSLIVTLPVTSASTEGTVWNGTPLSSHRRTSLRISSPVAEGIASMIRSMFMLPTMAGIWSQLPMIGMPCTSCPCRRVLSSTKATGW